MFLVALAPDLERIVLVGRVDPDLDGRATSWGSGSSSSSCPSTLAAGPQGVGPGALVRRRFWRVLDGVDGVWMLGPHPLGVVFAGLARLRGRSVTLGVRQDFRRYIEPPAGPALGPRRRRCPRGHLPDDGPPRDGGGRPQTSLATTRGPGRWS